MSIWNSIFIYTVGTFRKLDINMIQYIHAVFISYLHCVCPFRNGNDKSFGLFSSVNKNLAVVWGSTCAENHPAGPEGGSVKCRLCLGFFFLCRLQIHFHTCTCSPIHMTCQNFLSEIWNDLLHHHSCDTSGKVLFYTSSIRDILGKYGLHNMSVTLDKWAERW